MTLIEELLEIIKSKGGSASIEDICATYCKNHSAYFDRLVFIPSFHNLLSENKKLVHFNKDTKKWVLGDTITKYYVEFLSKNDWETEEQYFAQSLWFETKEECIDFVEDWITFHIVRFDYQQFTNNFKYYLMCADFDSEGNYGDIDQIGELVYNEREHQFEIVQ